MQALTLIMLSSSTSLNNSILENTDYFPAALSKLRSASQLFTRPSKHVLDTDCLSVQTKYVVSSPLFYTVGSLVYLAALAVWGCEGLLGSVWGAFRQCLADQQVRCY